MESLCLKIPKKMGERARRILLALGILDLGLKIKSEGPELFFPIKRKLNPQELGDLPEAEISRSDFEVLPRKESLQEILGFTPACEIIGDIAIIDGLDPEAERIADVLLRIGRAKTVLGALTPVLGEFRVREFRLLAGEPKTETIHKEYGCRYKLDLAEVYFSPRLSTEHSRVASQVKPGETLIDMFAGVGPFSILAAKRVPEAHIIAVDKNPVAVRYLKENISLNSLTNVEVLEGDIREFADMLREKGDHLVMNLPQKAHEYLDEALRIVKNNGAIHYYAISPEDELFEGPINLIKRDAERKGLAITIYDRRIVRTYAPYQYHVCVEFRVGKAIKGAEG